ncbi:MAG: hypothetical protein HY744_09615 [Deltaproteobacteria bacterium]|nr:hypothetical protein [Deltaproteobacteria bacterium]
MRAAGRLRLMVALSAIALGCAGTGPEPAPSRPAGLRRPPPKPGESITHTIMCTCKSCEPASCCQWKDERGEDAAGCSDGYDFSKCEGLQVQSCASRCFEHRWRIRVEEACEATRPRQCCR